MLVRGGLVWEQRLGPRILHFAGTRPPELSVRGAVEEHGLDPLDHVLLALLQAGTRGQNHILANPAVATVPSSTVQHHLYRLRRYGFVTEFRAGRHVYYQPVPVQAWPDTPTPVQDAEEVQA